MDDEKYVYEQEVREKKITARSARHTRTHCGKGGRVRLPSDNLSKKELQAMNGEVKSYRLNDPMKWKEFKSMPDDIKVTYIKLLREKFNCFDSAVAEMMGVNKVSFSNEIKRLGLGHGSKHGGRRTWNEKEAFWAWVHGVPIADHVEETFVEDVEKAFISPEDIHFDVGFMPGHALEIKRLPVREEKEKVIPRSGTMTLEGQIEDVLQSVAALLGGAKVSLYVSWEVFPEDVVCKHG